MSSSMPHRTRRDFLQVMGATVGGTLLMPERLPAGTAVVRMLDSAVR